MTDASMLGGLLLLVNVLLRSPVDEHFLMYAVIVSKVLTLYYGKRYLGYLPAEWLILNPRFRVVKMI